jgi:hypothetical protein
MTERPVTTEITSAVLLDDSDSENALVVQRSVSSTYNISGVPSRDEALTGNVEAALSRELGTSLADIVADVMKEHNLQADEVDVEYEVTFSRNVLKVPQMDYREDHSVIRTDGVLKLEGLGTATIIIC